MHDKSSIERFLMHAESIVVADPTISYMVVTRLNRTGTLSVLFYRNCNDDVASIGRTIAALGGSQYCTVVDVFFRNKSLAEQVAACATELSRRSVAVAA